ncbi:MAG: hypothetical protein AB9861_16720 [Methanosarcina sp.]
MIDSNLDLYTKINDDRDFGNIFKKDLFGSVDRHLTREKKKDGSYLQVFIFFAKVTQLSEKTNVHRK